MKVKVSVLMPIYNQERFLKESIASILGQSFKDCELLIMDDGSSDNSFKIIKSFQDKRIKVFQNSKRLGLAKCLNRLIIKSHGKYLARMDGDDISLQDRLIKQASFLDKNIKVALVGCKAKIINAKGVVIGYFKYPSGYQEIRKDILSQNLFVHPGIMMRKDIIKSLGGYDEKLFYSQDYDLTLRLVVKHTCYNLNQFLLKFRWLPDFKKQHQQHRLALLIRLKAIKEYGYSKTEIIKLIRPLLLYLIPKRLKQIYWQKKLR